MKKMAKKLSGYVHVNGTVYGPDDNVPADVAKEITNPDAWETSDEGGGDGLLKGQTDPSNYDGVSASVLKAEIKRRNEGREDEDKIPASGNRDELAAALLADDEPRTPA